MKRRSSQSEGGSNRRSIDLPRSILEASLEQVFRTLRPERALIAYRRSTNIPLHLAAQRGFVGNVSMDTLDISHSTILEVYEGAGSQQCLQSVTAVPGPTQSMKHAGIRSVLCAPVVHRSEGIIGVLYVDDTRKIGSFGPEHLAWLARVGSALAANARLMEVPEEATLYNQWADFRRLAHQASKSQDLDSAEEFLKKALACCEEGELETLCFSRTLGDLAEVLRRKGSIEQAESLLLEAIRLAEDCPSIPYPAIVPLYNNLGGLFVGRGLIEEAKAVFETVLQKLKGFPPQHWTGGLAVLCNLGTLYLGSGELVRALELFSEASRRAAELHGTDGLVARQCLAKLEECRRLIA